MKHLIPTTIVAACVLAASSASAEPLHRAEIKNLDYDFIETPRYDLKTAPDRAQERSPLQWLRASV